MMTFVGIAYLPPTAESPGAICESPSCTTDATSAPSCVNTLPRAIARPPAAYNPRTGYLYVPANENSGGDRAGAAQARHPGRLPQQPARRYLSEPKGQKAVLHAD
jgi:hypothetical protein